MKLRIALVSSALLYSSHCLAMFCPSNFNQINMGDSIKQVEAQCGKPATSTTQESELNQPQEWVYYVKLNPNDAGTVKVTFAFVDDKVLNLASNGVSIGSTQVCGGFNLQLGNTSKDVEKACGKPVMITKSDDPQSLKNPPPPTTITTWKYDGPTPNTLIFENDILKERK